MNQIHTVKIDDCFVIQAAVHTARGTRLVNVRTVESSTGEQLFLLSQFLTWTDGQLAPDLGDCHLTFGDCDLDYTVVRSGVDVVRSFWSFSASPCLLHFEFVVRETPVERRELEPAPVTWADDLDQLL